MITVNLIAVYLWIFVAHAQRVVLNDGTGTVIGRSGGAISSQWTTYSLTDMLKVNIRCSNDPISGLTCAAEYPDQCREQWNFPNPCTQQNLDMNNTKFAHPFDKTKFLMCGQLGKLYVVQCPQYEVFHYGCGQCVGEEAGLTASCEIPLPPLHNNPCTREAILANKLFFPFPGNLSKFIHCDIWGKPWERICTPGEVWSQWDVTCVLPHLLNPCNRPTTDLNYLYSHPCDPAKYLTCDAQGRAHEINCALGEAFYERNQRCQSYRDFEDQILNSFCENYIFGFRKFHGSGGFVIDPSRTAESVDLGLVTHEGIKVAGTGAISGIIGGGFNRDSRGFTVDRTNRNLGGSIRFTRDGAEQGIRANVDVRGGVLDRQAELQGQGDGTIGFDSSSQIRGGKLSGQITTDGQGGLESSFEIKRGSVNGSKSGTVDVMQTRFDPGTGTIDQVFKSGAATNFVDIRGKALSNGPTAAEFVDIRNQGTSGTSANLIDIRGEKGSGTRDMFDISSGTADGMVADVRGSQVVESSGMIDIRGQDLGSGSGNIVDVRGGKISGTKKMAEISGGSSGGSFDIIKSQTAVSGGVTGVNEGTGPIVNGGGNMFDIREGLSGSVMTDIRTSTTDAGSSRIDLGSVDSILGGPGGNMVDIRSSKSGGMTDIRGTNVDTSGIVGRTSGGEFIDIRTAKFDTTGSMSGTPKGDTSGTLIDFGGIDGVTSNIGDTGMVDVRGSKFETSKSKVDIRKATGDTSGKVDIRDSRIDTTGGMLDTSGTVDIRNVDTTGPIIEFSGLESGTADSGGASMFDIRGSTTVVDIRKAQDNKAGMVDIRGSKIDTTGGMLDTSGMVDIPDGTNIVDIMTPKSDTTGTLIDFGVIEGVSGNTVDTGMVDIRGSKFETSKSKVDIRKATGATSEMTDKGGFKIDTAGGMLDTSGTVDNRNVDTTGPILDFGVLGSGTDSNSALGVVNIRGSTTEVDIRKAQGDSSGMVDIRSSKIDTTGGILDTSGMVDIGNVDTAGPVIDFGGLESGTVSGSSTGMVDIRSSKIDTTRTAKDITGSQVDISGIDLVIGGKKDASVDIRGSTIDTSGAMIDIRGAQLDTTGVVDAIPGSISESSSMKVHGSRRETSGASVDITGNPSGIPGRVMVDIRREGIVNMPGFPDVIGQGIGSNDGLLTDTRAGNVRSKTADIRSGESGFLDITGSKTGLSSEAIDVIRQGSGTGGIDMNMIDIRGGKGFGTNNMVDIRGAINEGKMVDIQGSRTERARSVIDVSGGAGNGQLDIIGERTPKTMVDIRGTGQTNPENAGAGVWTKTTTTDIRNQPLSGQTSDAHWVDIRSRQGQGSVTGSNEMGLGGMTTIDLRKQLGLAGQRGITNDQNAGATEVTRTDTITIEGTVQGAQSSGTMQDLLNTWNKIIGGSGNGRQTFSQITGRQGFNSGGVFESSLNQPGNGKLVDTRMTVHPSRLRMYDYSDIPFNEPCTQENIDAGRTHFRFRNHPHMFLQCDASGRMHRMPCSTKGRDWFDVYTNTCVDGPVHVENLIQ